MLTGGGMTVALGDAALLCGMLRPLPDLGNSAATAQATAGFYSRRTPLSTTINTLANALYQVGSSPVHPLQVLGRLGTVRVFGYLEPQCTPVTTAAALHQRGGALSPRRELPGIRSPKHSLKSDKPGLTSASIGDCASWAAASSTLQLHQATCD